MYATTFLGEKKTCNSYREQFVSSVILCG